MASGVKRGDRSAVGVASTHDQAGQQEPRPSRCSEADARGGAARCAPSAARVGHTTRPCVTSSASWRHQENLCTGTRAHESLSILDSIRICPTPDSLASKQLTPSNVRGGTTVCTPLRRDRPRRGTPRSRSGVLSSGTSTVQHRWRRRRHRCAAPPCVAASPIATAGSGAVTAAAAAAASPSPAATIEAVMGLVQVMRKHRRSCCSAGRPLRGSPRRCRLPTYETPGGD